MSATPFLEALAGRRSVYALKKESPISDERITEIVSEIIKHIPSSFNSQSTRAIILLKDEHDKLWNIHKEVLQGVVPADQYEKTEQKMNMFQAAYGTILFFTDRPTTQGFQNQFPTYADRFPQWATESSGAHQIAAWAALEAEGLGANLQHYNPLIDEKVRDTWNISADWELHAELVFGTPAAPAGEKTFKPILGERLLVFGGDKQ